MFHSLCACTRANVRSKRRREEATGVGAPIGGGSSQAPLPFEQEGGMKRRKREAEWPFVCLSGFLYGSTAHEVQSSVNQNCGGLISSSQTHSKFIDPIISLFWPTKVYNF